ncbi:winged helix-turn-helix domain-containing protein [Streptomyces sp. NPDC085614]|uniref:winged helix-turn-helix domain-containing protein n=1 Tax=Streptomyces sp. NPDC085614 TaxID=3365733 RepID=UPI0037D58B35
MTLSGISQMLRRHGWSHRVPARRAVKGDEAGVAGRVKEMWPHLEPARRPSGLRTVFELPSESRNTSAAARTVNAFPAGGCTTIGATF